MWHVTAVSCSLCKNIEDEEEAEYRREEVAYRNAIQRDPNEQC